MSLDNMLHRLRQEFKALNKRMRPRPLVTVGSLLNEQILVNGKIKVSHLELISVHIPKTAGTSFRNILSDIYGKGLFRVDIDIDSGSMAVNQDPNFSALNVSAMTVAHGHFNMEQFREKFEYDPNIPVIVWLRDPIERIISHYRYKSSILHNYANKRVLRVLRHMEKSLFEFASLPSSQNLITNRFFNGMKLGNFAFVGIVENYDEDIRRLSRFLDWKVKTIYRHNITKKKSAKVSEEELRVIKNLNSKDIEIYKQAKANL